MYYSQGLAFVYEATGVAENDGVLTVTAKEAKDGAILEYDFSGEITAEVTAVELNQEPVTLMDASGETFTLQQAELQAFEGTHDFEDIKIKWNVLSGNGVSGTLSGAIKNIRLEVYEANLLEVRFRLKGDINITSTLSMDFTKNSSAKSITLGKAKLADFGTVEMTLNLQMKVEVGFVFDGSFTIGPDYKLGQKIYWEKAATLKESTYVSVNGYAEALLTVHANIGIPNIATMDGRLTVGPKASGYAKEYALGSPRTCVNAEGYLYGNVNLTATLLKKSFPLYDTTFLDRNSPTRFACHFEDGKRVSKCTCPNREGKADSGYSTPKYSTPVNSRFYADNSRDASSTWSGSANAEPVVIWTTADNDNGTVTVTGYSGNASILNIPETIDGKTVTAIGDKAFQNKTIIRIVNMPDTVTSIGKYAFQNCSNLTTISFVGSVSSIGVYAFSGCAMASADLPEGLLEIGARCFLNCVNLESVYIPATLEKVTPYIHNSGVTYDYNNTFSGCEKLNAITFGEGIPLIAAYLFDNCPGITHIEIPDTVTTIGACAFMRCSNLATIQIPDSVTAIGKSAFYNSGLTAITIPDSISAYSDNVLRDCAKLVSANLSETALVIPAAMFSGCSSLESITIPDGVKVINNETFKGCSALKTAALPDSVTKIGNSAFADCAVLTDLTWLPYTVTSIGNGAFQNCAGLTSAALPDLVSSLGENAFKGCAGLVSFEGGADLLSIGNNCFQDCASLTDVDLVDGLKTIGNYAFQNCAKLEKIVLPDSVTSIGTYIFQQAPALKDVTLSKGLTVIPSYAFANCTALERLDIPKGVTTIKGYAFYQDTNLKTFTIPASVANIEGNAFSYPAMTTVYGVAGSYAQSFANWQSFIDITKAASGLALASGANSMTIGNGLTVTPVFTLFPSDSTEVISLTSDDADIVSVENDGISLRGRRNGTTNVTATTSGNKRYVFSVTVDRFSGIEIASQPNTTEFDVGARKNLTGLAVNALFSNGNREPIYDYTASGFTTDRAGIYAVTITYNRQSAAFQIVVGGGDPDIQSGTMGKSGELQWTYNRRNGQVTVIGSISVNEPILVGGYSASGELLSIDTITVSGGTAQTANGRDDVRLFWSDSNHKPKCGKIAIHVT